MNFKIISLVLGMVIGPVLLIGCGKSDPASDFPNLKKVVPAHDGEIIRKEGEPNLLILDIPGPNEVNFGQFEEGRTGSIPVRVRRMRPETIKDYKLEITEVAPSTVKTKDISLNKSATDPDLWLLQWTPPVGYVAMNRGDSRLSVRIAATILVKDKEYEEREELKLTVTKNTVAPKIKGINGLPEKVSLNEGTVVPFSVDVYLPPGNGVGGPSLSLTSFNSVNNETYEANGSAYVLIDRTKPLMQDLGGGIWQFRYLFDLKNLPLLTPLDIKGNRDLKANSVVLCFNLQAKKNANLSDEELVCRKVNFIAQSPEIIWEGDGKTSEVTSDSANTLKFVARSKNGVGQVTVQNMTAGFAALPGHPQLDCSDATRDPTSRSCEIQWQVPCGTKKLYTLEIKASNRVQEQVKSAQSTRQVNVLTKPDTCKAPEPAAKPEAKAPVKPDVKVTAKPSVDLKKAGGKQ